MLGFRLLPGMDSVESPISSTGESEKQSSAQQDPQTVTPPGSMSTLPDSKSLPVCYPEASATGKTINVVSSQEDAGREASLARSTMRDAKEDPDGGQLIEAHCPNPPKAGQGWEAFPTPGESPPACIPYILTENRKAAANSQPFRSWGRRHLQGERPF